MLKIINYPVFKILEQIFYSGFNYFLIFGLSIIGGNELVGTYAKISIFLILVNIAGVSVVSARYLIDFPRVKKKKEYTSAINFLKLIYGVAAAIVSFFYWNSYLSLEISTNLNNSSAGILFSFFVVSGLMFEFYRREFYLADDWSKQLKWLLLCYFSKAVFVIVFGNNIFKLMAIISVCNIGFIRFNWKSGKRIIKYLKFHISESWKILLSGLIGYSIQYLPLYYASLKFDLESLGLFFAIKTASNIGNVFMEYMENNLPGIFSKMKNSGEKVNYTKILFSGFLIWLCLGLACILFGYNFYLPKIASERMSEAVSVFSVLWIAVYVYFAQRLVILSLRVYRNAYFELLSGLFTLIIILLGFNIFDVKDALGVSYAYLAISCIQLLILRLK